MKTCAVTFIWTAEVHRMTYRYGGERGVAICQVAEDRDDRGPLPYVHATACDIEDEALLDELEAAALAAWERHAASSSTRRARSGSSRTANTVARRP